MNGMRVRPINVVTGDATSIKCTGTAFTAATEPALKENEIIVVAYDVASEAMHMEKVQADSTRAAPPPPPPPPNKKKSWDSGPGTPTARSGPEFCVFCRQKCPKRWDGDPFGGKKV